MFLSFLFQFRYALWFDAILALVELGLADAANVVPVLRRAEQHAEDTALGPAVQLHIIAQFGVFLPAGRAVGALDPRASAH